VRTERRELQDLISIGPAMLRDFELLGILSVRQLAKQDPQTLYDKLGRVAPQHMDICRGAGQESAIARGAMPVVVVEQKAEATS
jgi:nucleotidyltransferase/DNA polymerase involved in DNA repair